MCDEAPGAATSVPPAERVVNTAGDAPRKRRIATNQLPLEQRILIDLLTAANLSSVSCRTMKRIGQDHPELTVTLNRRRLFHQAKLRAWLAAGCPAPKATRR